MNPLNIAVIGSGISGLSAAWLLDKKHTVTLFEADNRIGGHSNTVTMDVNGQKVPVDTGFICFNEATYPNLCAFFDHLDVSVHRTDMGFSASMARGAYEYAGGTYWGLFGQPSNLVRPSHWRMIKDILRFFREAPGDVGTLNNETTLMQYLERENYSRGFIDHHLLPMAAAIWSSKLDDMMAYPARAFIRFFQNHGLLQVEGRPKWGTVVGGSRVYVSKLLADSSIITKTGTGIKKVKRLANGVSLTDVHGAEHHFDQVVIASHGDQALAMLDDPSHNESELLGKFAYAKNKAVLHRDRRYMPRRRLTWASWNYLDFDEKVGASQAQDEKPPLCVTYWMNSLQDLPTRENIFVTLNPPEGADIENVAAELDYMHPLFDAAAMNAQQELWSLQGVNRTWFCGAHFGAGFHEDGLQAGLAVAEQLGNVRRPWNVENESGRISVLDGNLVKEAAE